MKNKKAFTLIELIAVLVILAILALIVTPLVLNIIKKARTSADKRNIDAYGRSIELAVADYLLDKGEFPTSIEQLQVEYTGDEVVCNTTTLNEDGGVYLKDCTVGGRTVSGYTYGKEEIITYKAYSIGDEVTYNGVDYYVIKDSSERESNVTLLKSDPLTVEEVTEYGTGHINRYTSDSVGITYNENGYGGMAYYSSQTCGYENNNSIETGCVNSYEQSDIKYVVDNWSQSKVPNGLVEARLITYDDLTDNLGYEKKNQGTIQPSSSGETPSWVYNSNYAYWTMSPRSDDLARVYNIERNGRLDVTWGGRIYQYACSGIVCVVRPVIVLSKSVLN